MNIQQMVETIVKGLIEQIEEKSYAAKILIIFCDNRAREAFFDQFIVLHNAGIHYDMLCLDGETSGWLGSQCIESGGNGKAIVIDDSAPAPIELPKEYDAIIVPELDLDNAARIAMGMKGTIKSELIFAALLLNKPVFIGEDSSGICRADRHCLKVLELRDPYQSKFLYYVKELKQLGIYFSPYNELTSSVVEKIKPSVLNRVTLSKVEQTMPLQDNYQFSGSLLSAEWVNANPMSQGSSIVVQHKAIVTSLAFDMLKQRKVKVQLSDER